MYHAITAASVTNPLIAGVYAFMIIFMMWLINLLSNEIEQPFGDDDSDIPLRQIQAEMVSCTNAPQTEYLCNSIVDQ